MVWVTVRAISTVSKRGFTVRLKITMPTILCYAISRNMLCYTKLKSFVLFFIKQKCMHIKSLCIWLLFLVLKMKICIGTSTQVQSFIIIILSLDYKCWITALMCTHTFIHSNKKACLFHLNQPIMPQVLI